MAAADSRRQSLAPAQHHRGREVGRGRVERADPALCGTELHEQQRERLGVGSGDLVLLHQLGDHLLGALDAQLQRLQAELAPPQP